ncbi:hypothetical protein Q4519_08790 [Motilimonas sp. 1_MG-2023]|uniref:hypothetical protein n=1 Tax=Motilimonas sp. 1_MG-2023 TaxID=3062672 RepID=UPI0026E13E4A|nr:hypothetical protein [Motilimonas sp. 1_MG-2023]MDO6525780.1 hypothetical protein [Motilimonas sp. 1_MG-2023]
MDSVLQQALSKHCGMVFHGGNGLSNIEAGLESLELITQFIESSDDLHVISPVALAHMLTNVQMMLHVGLDQMTAHSAI